MKLQLDESDLRPLVRAVVAEVLQQTRDDQAKMNGRLGYTEPDAAALLGIQPHVLRDCRRRGEITGRLVGKRIVYSRDALLRFLGGDTSIRGHE